MSDKGNKGGGDKTVIGGALPITPRPTAPRPASPPPQTPPQPTPGLQQPPGAAPTPAGGDRTVIGGDLPPATPRPASPAPPPAGGGRVAPGQGGYNQGFDQSDTADAWMGGPAQSTAGIGGAGPDGFFPDHRPVEPQQSTYQGPKIDLRSAMSAGGLGGGSPSNPIVAAATNLLILFGRLRTEMVEMEAVPLMEHVTREIDAFEANVLEAGVDPHEAQVAKYCLCGTADDIVQNIPGQDRHVWVQYSMVARFFNKRTSGVGFFQEVEKALQAPAQRFQVLELMQICLSLGFEGKYRSDPNGPMELARIRAAIYESLRRVQPRPDEDISVRWQGVELGNRRLFQAIPLWAVASVVGLLLLGVYLGLSMLISRDGAMISERLLAMHPSEIVGLQRASAFTPYEFPEEPVTGEETTQLDRIRESLDEEIAAGQVNIDTKGDWIFVRVNNLVLFDTGSADTKPEFEELAEEVAEAVNPEPGPMKVVGYTDNVPMSGRGRYKNNFDLSVARATGVNHVLAKFLEKPERVIVEGKGADDPIADNGTAEGRALNRRVEIMIRREESLQDTEATE